MSKSNNRVSKKILKGGDDISNQHLKNLEREIDETNETFSLVDLESQVVSVLKKINSKILAELVPPQSTQPSQPTQTTQPTRPTDNDNEEKDYADMVGGKKAKKTSKKASKKSSKKGSKSMKGGAKKSSKKSSKKGSKKSSKSTKKPKKM